MIIKFHIKYLLFVEDENIWDDGRYSGEPESIVKRKHVLLKWRSP